MDSHTLLTIRPSRRLAAIVLAAHLLACCALVLAGLPWRWRVLLLAAVAASYVLHRKGNGECFLRCQEKGGMEEWRGGEWVGVELLPDTVVLPWLVVLRYRLAGAGRPVVKSVFMDSMCEDDFRRLGVWLKWRSGYQPSR